MKFIISCSLIKPEIELATNFSSARNSLSISSNVLFENSNDTLTIKATDGKLGFISSIPVQTIVPGSTTVFCDKLVAVLKNIPDVDLEFSGENGKLTIRPVDKNNNINVNIKTTDASKYPSLLLVPETDFFSLTQKEVSEMIDKTSFAVGEESSRIFLTGVFMEKRDDKLVMVATDGRRLAYIAKQFEQVIPEFKGAIIPTKFLFQLKNLLSDEGVFSMAVTEDEIFAQIGQRTIYSSLINGNYPNYDRVIPKSFQYECKMKKKDMEDAINLISVLVEAKSKRIFIDINTDGVMLSSENADFGDSKQIIPCSYNGPESKISFNYNLLSTPIKKLDSDFFKISFNNTASAMAIFPEPEKDYLFVLMPMQV